MSNIYNFPYSLFPDNDVNLTTLTDDIRSSTITKALDYTSTVTSQCSIVFKAELSQSELSTLSGIVALHDSSPIYTSPRMADGRPIVRAETRPLDTSTYFTMASDTASGIGDGTELRWDFSDPDNYPTMSGGGVFSCGFVVPEGYKAYKMDLYFIDPVYFKDGTIYHFDSPWGQHCYMTIVVPAGNYYPNDHGDIPASALGLSGSQMYSYAATDTAYYSYINKHYMYGDCPMGDELNAEGCMVDALPPGWFVRGLIITPEDDFTSKGMKCIDIDQ